MLIGLKKQWQLRLVTQMGQGSSKIMLKYYDQALSKVLYLWNHVDAQSTIGLQATWCKKGGIGEEERTAGYWRPPHVEFKNACTHVLSKGMER